MYTPSEYSDNHSFIVEASREVTVVARKADTTTSPGDAKSVKAEAKSLTWSTTKNIIMGKGYKRTQCTIRTSCFYVRRSDYTSLDV